MISSEFILRILLILSIIYPGVLFSQDNPTDPEEIQDRKITAESLFDSAVEYFDHRSYIEAIDLFDAVLAKKPKMFEAWYFKGLAQDQILDTKSAIISLETAIQLKPDFSEAVFSLALMEYKEQNFQAALNDFEKSLSMPPGETHSVFFRGVVPGNYDNKPVLNQILTMHDKSADIYNFLGLCNWRLGRTDKSLDCFNRSLQIFNKDDNIYVNRGLVYAQTGKNDSAIQDYKKALSINPNNSMAKYNLVILGQETGGNTKNETDRLLSESGDLSASFAYRAYMKFNQNKFMESILDYDTAILLDRNNPELYLNRGLVLEKTDSLDAALRDYLIAGTIAPDLDKVYYAQGNIWYKLNNYSKSITLYSRAISLNPGNGYAYYNRALSYYKISSLHNACYDAEKARDLGVNEAQEFINNACSGKN